MDYCKYKFIKIIFWFFLAHFLAIRIPHKVLHHLAHSMVGNANFFVADVIPFSVRFVRVSNLWHPSCLRRLILGYSAYLHCRLLLAKSVWPTQFFIHLKNPTHRSEHYPQNNNDARELSI